MTPPTHAPRVAPEPPRWFRRPAPGATPCVWREVVRARGGRFEARLRLCADGGCVVTFPALPHLMTRGANCQHARLKAQALVDRYLRALAAARRRASEPGQATHLSVAA